MTAGIEKINYLYVKQPESSPLRSNNLRLSGQISEIGQTAATGCNKYTHGKNKESTNEEKT